MKKLVALLAFVVVITALRDVIGYFGPMAQAYRAYRSEAEAAAHEHGKRKAFRDVEGHIVDVSYRLDSATPAGDDQVRLVVLEAIQFQRGSEMRPFGNRRVAQTRQHVLMRRVDGAWKIANLEEDATEVVELADVAAP